MLKRIFGFLFGPSMEIPPAASDYKEGDTDWAKRPHNRHLSGVVSKAKTKVIRQMDMRSKARYDNIDTHIRRLCELKMKIRAKKAVKQAAAMVTFEPEPSL